MSKVLFSVTEEELLELLKEDDQQTQELIRCLIFKDENYIKKVVKELVNDLVKKLRHRLDTKFTAVSLLGSNPPTLYQVFVKSEDFKNSKKYTFISNRLYTSYEAAYNSVNNTPDELIEIRAYKL